MSFSCGASELSSREGLRCRWLLAWVSLLLHEACHDLPWVSNLSSAVLMSDWMSQRRSHILHRSRCRHWREGHRFGTSVLQMRFMTAALQTSTLFFPVSASYVYLGLQLWLPLTLLIARLPDDHVHVELLPLRCSHSAHLHLAHAVRHMSMHILH